MPLSAVRLTPRFATFLVAAVLASVRLLSAAETTPRNERAIADVAAGKTETAHASWWGFDPADATAALQAALDCPAKRILVEDMGQPWIVTTIRLPSDKEIVFEPEVFVEAKRGAFLGKGDCLFLARGCRNLAIRGNGATFRMHKADYHKPPYEPAEWRHALSIRGCTNVIVEDLTLAESGGDGIYLGTGTDGATNRDVTIRKVICDGNNRQGISVITAEDLLIEDSVFSNTRGTAPQAGIDFEPNRPGERLVNCVLRNCRSIDNAGHAYHLYLGQMNADSPPISIRFENCTSKGCERYSTYVGVANRNGERTVRGSIEYVDCRFEADAGAGVYIRGNEADGCEVAFRRCEIIRRDEEDSRLAPITIEAPRRLDLDTGNIEFEDCVVRDSLTRQPILLVASPMTRLENVSGAITVVSPTSRQEYTLDAEQLARWFPRQGLLARIPRQAFDWRALQPVDGASPGVEERSTFRLRREAAFVVWGEADRELEIVARLETVGRDDKRSPGAMALTAPNGNPSELKAKIVDEELVYRFTPQSTGPHRLHWQGGNRTTLRVVRCSSAWAMSGDSFGLNLFRSTGTLYFAVPVGIKRFAVQVTGAGTAETVKATVCDAAGRTVEARDNIAAPHAFVLTRDEIDSTEIWSVTLERASEGVLEDVSVQTLGVPPVFATTAEDMLVPKASP